MNIIAADDEPLALEMLTQAIEEACPDARISAFTTPSEVLKYAQSEQCDIAFLDIQMRGTTGIALAKKLKDINGDINIIFVTGFDEYTGDAMAIHASGYILKPVTPDKIKAELQDLRHPIEILPNCFLRVQCFGNFEVYTPDGKPVRFERTKAKEVFAYLIYRHGASCTIKEIAAAIFEDAEYDHKQRVYMQKIISSLMSTMKSVGAENTIIKNYNSIAVNPATIDCDYYRFGNLDSDAVNSYKGEFMSQYSWGEFLVGYLERIYNSRKQ